MNEISANFGEGSIVIGTTHDQLIHKSTNPNRYDISCSLNSAGIRKMRAQAINNQGHIDVQFVHRGRQLSGKFHIQEVSGNTCFLLSSGRVEQVGI
jgi:hypothetical protein